MPRPTLSVVMCTYNGARYLAEQMDSILAQDVPIDEIVVHDDGSTDGTLALLDDYAQRLSGKPDAPQLIIHRNAKNLGYNANFRTALLVARGEYIAIADQDDVWFSHKLRTQLQAIGSAALCYSGHYRGALPAGLQRPPRASDFPAAALSSPVYPPERLIFTNCVPGHTCLLRRDFVQGIAQWDDRLFYDWQLALCALFAGGIAHVAEGLNWHRPHEASAITTLFAEKGKRPRGYVPYLTGWGKFRAIRRKPQFQALYQHLADQAAQTMPLVAQLSRAMAGRDGGLPRLCYLCLRHRRTVYPRRGEPAWLNALRAACYPAIWADGDIAFRA